MKIFITGGTGFLGKKLVRDLSKIAEIIYVLTRNTDVNLFDDLPNVKLVAGDITKPYLIDSQKDKDLIRNECTHVLHAAAYYQLNGSYSDCFMQNVVGTQTIIQFVKSIKNLKILYYVSTIAVLDDQTYYSEEDRLPVRQIFTDHYSETKYLAEKLIRESLDKINVPIRIIRPGIIVGDSTTGEMEKIDGPYYFINSFQKNLNLLRPLKFLPLSYQASSKIPLIPVDHCSRFIALIVERDSFKKKMETYHLISDEIPSIQDFLEDLCTKFSLKIRFLPVPKNKIHNFILINMGIPKEVIPFMFSKISYDKTNIISVVPEILESRYSNYKEFLLKK